MYLQDASPRSDGRQGAQSAVSFASIARTSVCPLGYGLAQTALSIDFDELAAHNLMRRTALTDMHVEMPEIASIANAFLNAESVKNFTQ